MCLVLLGWRAHPEYRLIVAANRDEFYTRPTESLRDWPEVPELLAGRDLGAGNALPGTWLGLFRDSPPRFASVTNVRGRGEDRDARSRGAMLLDFLRGTGPGGTVGPKKFVRALAAGPDDYNGYNLAITDLETLWWHSNRSDAAPRELAPGFHGLSNGRAVASSGLRQEDSAIETGTADTAWPKVRSGITALRAVVESTPGDMEGYFEVLADRTETPDEELPHTGMPKAAERASSARFVSHVVHGTRCSTVLLVREDGSYEMAERSFGRLGRAKGEVTFNGRLKLPD